MEFINHYLATDRWVKRVSLWVSLGAFGNSCRKMEQDGTLEKGQQECVCVFVGRWGVGHKASLGNE